MMVLTFDAVIYMTTTLCAFALGVGLGAYIENRRIKKTDIENLIRKNMLSNINLYENLCIPVEVVIEREYPNSKREITEEITEELPVYQKE
tara:strand:+ start:691 stop:963 length:273 start_codon:yes stop_codon:yes gene_type:complete